MTQKQQQKPQTQEPPKGQQQQAPPAENLPAIIPTRLPYHPIVEQRYGIDALMWRALVDSIYPNAKTLESIILVLSYCKARNLDVFKRPCHIVGIWSTALNRMVDSVWPGIGELRTTAFRTGEYAGADPTNIGPTVKGFVGEYEMEYPEWMQITLYRRINGERIAFPGPRVYFMETYATEKRDSYTPNSMWAQRPNGQLEKCAEAAALRKAFPEEIGTEYVAEEMERVNGRFQTIQTTAKTIPPGQSKGDALAADIKARQQAQQTPAIEHTEPITFPEETIVNRDGETVPLQRAKEEPQKQMEQEPPPEPKEAGLFRQILAAIKIASDSESLDRLENESSLIQDEDLRKQLIAELRARKTFLENLAGGAPAAKSNKSKQLPGV